LGLGTFIVVSINGLIERQMLALFARDGRLASS